MDPHKNFPRKQSFSRTGPTVSYVQTSTRNTSTPTHMHKPYLHGPMTKTACTANHLLHPMWIQPTLASTLVDGINPYGWTRGEHHRPLPTKLSSHLPQPAVNRVETPVLRPTIKAMDPISCNPPPWAWPSAYSNQNARVCVDTPTQHLELLQQRQQISHNSVPTKHAIWSAQHLCGTQQTPASYPQQDLSHHQSRTTNQTQKVHPNLDTTNQIIYTDQTQNPGQTTANSNPRHSSFFPNPLTNLSPQQCQSSLLIQVHMQSDN